MGECNLLTFRTNHLLRIDGPNLYYFTEFRFAIYDEMSRDPQTFTNFKKDSISNMFGCYTGPTIIVAVRYSGVIDVLNTHDPNSSKSIIDLDPEEGPYHVWCSFTQENLAQEYVAKLRSIDITSFIPKDPRMLKAARRVHLINNLDVSVICYPTSNIDALLQQ